MNEYTHIGMLFEKKQIEDHFILIPITPVRCNIINEETYDVENLGELSSVFQSCFDTDEKTIGFATPISEIKKINSDYNIAIENYKNEILPYLFVQTYNMKSGGTATYKLDFYENIFFKIAEFIDGEIIYYDEEIKYLNTKEKNILNKGIESEEDIDNNSSSKIEINMKELYSYIREYVIGQDETVKKIISTIHRNYNIDNYRNKTNILLIGPSGSGKTEIFKTLSNKINVPITIEDSEQYSAVGYEGANINDMLIKLYYNADGDLEAAERGILVIDEIDKKVTGLKGDVSGQRILNSLLSLMEGCTFKINITGDAFNPNYVNFSTNKLTVVLIGAFSDITKSNKGVGFENELKKRTKYNKITIDDLHNYGLSNEILRRVSVYKLNELTVDDLMQIMLSSKNSALTEYSNYAKKQGLNLDIDDKAIKKIAELALKKNIGASGIKAILNEILNDAFFEISLNNNSINSIKITEESIDNDPPYILVKN